jgi:tRNA(Ile)-lysidine synthetase-like protein
LSNYFNKLVQLTEDALEAIPKGIQGVSLSCSGGPDSTALLYVFSEITKRKKNFSIDAIHFNYGLRGDDSDNDQNDFEKKTSLLEIKYKTILVDHKKHPKTGLSTQEWARSVRYDVYQDLISQGRMVVLGHHADDLAENALMRMSRGVGLGHMGGMSVYHEGMFRPFLNAPKDLILNALDELGITFAIDKTNAETIYTRNFIRHEILPKLNERIPGSTAHIARLARDSRHIAEFVRSQLSALIGQAKSPQGLDIKALRALPLGVIKFFLAEFIHENSQLIERTAQLILSDISEQMSFDLAHDLQLTLTPQSLRVSDIAHKTQPRHAQHLSSIMQKDYDCVLPPQGSVNLTLDHSHSCVVQNLSAKENLHIGLRRLAPSDRIKVGLMQFSQRIKNLSTPAMTDKAMWLITKNGQDECILLEDNLWIVDKSLQYKPYSGEVAVRVSTTH